VISTDGGPEGAFSQDGSRGRLQTFNAAQVFAAAVKAKVLGVLGGSGLYDPSFLRGAREKTVKTPFGKPSDALRIGDVGDLRVVFIPRHGRKHSMPANLVNHGANLWAMKQEKVSHVIATSSSGSLKKAIKPGCLVVPDDFMCFWSIPTVTDDVHHVTPQLDPEIRSLLTKAASKARAEVRKTGTYVQTLGPRLETKAEIAFFKDYGDILGMTLASEATIACELDMAYASLCSVDNYCNGIMPEPLTYKQIVRQQKVNSGRVIAALKAALEMLS